MKISISNIAWTNEEEPLIASELSNMGVDYVEIAPTKKWDDPTKTPDTELSKYKEFWSEKGLKIVAFQSMLFNRPDLKIFESEEQREEAKKYLLDFIQVAGKMGVGAMVFGSPKNRQRQDLERKAAINIAVDFFGELGAKAYENGVDFCIEPNAPQYACDFITNAQEGIDFVRRVGVNGFGLHLDIACMTLAGDNIAESIVAAAPLLKHFHISSPMLEQVEYRSDVSHAEAGEALRGINYNGFVSIEMKPYDDGANLERVIKAVRLAQKYYY